MESPCKRLRMDVNCNDLSFDAWNIVYQYIHVSIPTFSPSLVFSQLTLRSQQCVYREITLRKQMIREMLIHEKQKQLQQIEEYKPFVQELIENILTNNLQNDCNKIAHFWKWMIFSSEVDSFAQHINEMTSTNTICPWTFIKEILFQHSHQHCVCQSRYHLQHIQAKEKHHELLNRWFVSCLLTRWSHIKNI